MRLTKRNPETGQYEYIEKAKTLAEFRAQRKAVIQRLGEYEDRAVGHWERYGYDSSQCSLCGNVNTNFINNNFCPNCGAKMDGEGREGK